MKHRVLKFFRETIWNIRIVELPKRLAIPLNLSRVISLSTRNFVKNKCDIRASALTFYSLLAVVPVAALLFGIAKGYGMESVFKARFRESMIGHELVAEKIITFAESLLTRASGGVVAGFGVILLLWTAIKLLASIESSFNDIWGVHQGRSWIRKLSDYLTMLIVCPLLLFVVVSSSTVVVGRLLEMAQRLPYSQAWTILISFGVKLLPFFLAWVSFTFVYLFIPNTRVRIRAALIAGIFTGTSYLLIQYLYIYAQKHLTAYNAVYGSFAALPFFLLWLQISWTVVLLGAQLSFAIQNVSIYEFAADDRPMSIRYRWNCAIRICRYLANAFGGAEHGVSAAEMSRSLEIPIRVVRKELYELTDAGLVNELFTEKYADDLYQIAKPPETITPVLVIRALSRIGGVSGYDTAASTACDNLLDKLAEEAADSSENRPLRDDAA